MKTLVILASFLVGYLTANDAGSFQKRGFDPRSFTMQLSRTFDQVDRNMRHASLTTRTGMTKVVQIQRDMVSALNTTSNGLRHTLTHQLHGGS